LIFIVQINNTRKIKYARKKDFYNII